MAINSNSGFNRSVSANSRCVLVAVDGSQHSKTAFNYYRKWISRPDDAVIVYHAIEPMAIPAISINSLGSTSLTEEWSKVIQRNFLNMKEMETMYTKECRSHNLTHQFVYEAADQEVGGNIGAAIVKKAKRVRAQLIVVGSRGMGAFRRTVIGSVSDYVLHHAINTAVCVVPGSIANGDALQNSVAKRTD